jgi:glucose/arabinose dehydrogenase
MAGEEGKAPRLTRPARLLLVALTTVVVLMGAAFVERRALLGLAGIHIADQRPGLTQLRLPPGFQASLYASGLRRPRFATFGPDGTLYVANEGAGQVVALLDPDHTGRATRTVVVASGLNNPNSVTWFQGALYVGTFDRVVRLKLGPDHVASAQDVVIPNLPTGGNHVTRTVLFGPDGRLFVSIGSTCNNCVESDPRRAVVMIFGADGSGGRVYARGLRNAVGLAVNPWTNEIWATNNGRDLLGDNVPPDNVYALQDGGNYGWPRCQAGTIIDPDLGRPGDCTGVVQPLVNLQAHSAPLGLAFYGGPGAGAGVNLAFPPAWRGLFVAFHGSWNRSVPTGYKVVFIPLDGAGHVAGPPRDFATGFLGADGVVTGRPVGLAVGPDGALYVTDDAAGEVYRITYKG